MWDSTVFVQFYFDIVKMLNLKYLKYRKILDTIRLYGFDINWISKLFHKKNQNDQKQKKINPKVDGFFLANVCVVGCIAKRKFFLINFSDWRNMLNVDRDPWLNGLTDGARMKIVCFFPSTLFAKQGKNLRLECIERSKLFFFPYSADFGVGNMLFLFKINFYTTWALLFFDLAGLLLGSLVCILFSQWLAMRTTIMNLKCLPSINSHYQLKTSSIGAS